MTALAHETLEAVMPKVATPPSDLDDVLWQAWKAMELPEGYHAEIVEGFIEVSPTGRYSHGRTVNRLRDQLVAFLAGGEFAARQDMNVIHKRKVWIPDLFVALEDTEGHVTEDGLGVDASAVALIVEVVSPGSDNITRDRTRKRRDYARAAVPVYVLIDDFDDGGTVTVLTSPNPGKAVYEDESRTAYGTPVAIPTGPAKGFTIGEDVTGPVRGGG
ncbi:Uma2 family endonuclease [Streptomyces sp. NBC_00335]|uniref:Uma2 family endonuclease n=1 Tax=unclassified Streptomyces TaxID=2593676 RepID=UPI0022502803|nr:MULTISPECIES: Uma2 family endonuclease [unclassified Streptomyces]MCX5406662.1 Uma2 family endonuclease [Streptomyces sp. NBC_00086]